MTSQPAQASMQSPSSSQRSLSLSRVQRDRRWDDVHDIAPTLTDTCLLYVDQIAVSARPATADAAERNLLYLAEWLIGFDPAVTSLAQLTRAHVQHYKRYLATRRTPTGKALKPATMNQRLGMVRVAIERLIEWDHPDTPTRNPILGTDLPKLDEPLPKFLDDEQATKFMHAATQLDPLRRLVVEMLARTGMRAGELCALRSDAVNEIGGQLWLQIPVGKLHTDRYIPLHPILNDLLNTWHAPRTTQHDRAAHHQPRWARPQPALDHPHGEPLRS